MRDRARATIGIGLASFAGPFVVASLAAYGLLDWTVKASLIAGIALSTTSLAVVYAVLVERGLSDTRIGKLLMSATFATDLCTALALTLIFVKPNAWFPVFLVVSLAAILVLPRAAPWFFGRYGDRVIEPEIKLVFAGLLILMVLADASNGHAVLPAFVLGLMMSRHYDEHREEQTRLRVVAFAFLTPFFFLRGGMNVSLGAVFANLGLLALLLAAKMLPKLGVVYPLARKAVPKHAAFSTLLMSTGLTFGTISSLYGLNAGIINKTQFSLLVTVVVLSAVVPTAIAERWFLPDANQERHEERPHLPLPSETPTWTRSYWSSSRAFDSDCATTRARTMPHRLPTPTEEAPSSYVSHASREEIRPKWMSPSSAFARCGTKARPRPGLRTVVAR
jgi:Kef-type K+ transport system membrane component KefB